MRNVELINLAKIPTDLAQKAKEALLASKVETPDTELDELASKATLHMAKVDGQKARQADKLGGA